MNMAGILLWYLAVFVLAGAIIVALGLLVAGLARAAKFLFAGGFMFAALIAGLATLSFLDPRFHSGANEAGMIALAAVVLLLAGIGPFIAAFRSRGRYAATLACAVGALAIGTLAAMGGSDVFPFKLPAVEAVSVLLVAASVMIALLPPYAKQVAPDDKFNHSEGDITSRDR
jgi:hypothetical protein